MVDPREQVEQLLDEVVALAGESESRESFGPRFLSAVIAAVGAGRGALWSVGDPWPDRPWAEIGPAPTVGLPSGAGAEVRQGDRRGLLRRFVAEGEPAIVLPGARDPQTNELWHAGPGVLLLTPLLGPAGQVAGQVAGVCEVELPASTSPAVRSAGREVLAAFCGAGSRFLEREAVRNWRSRVQDLEQWRDLLPGLHGTLDSRRVAAALVNEGRIYLGCDRVTVVEEQRGRPRLRAISGQSTVDGRAPAVAALEELARAVWLGGEPIVFPPGDQGLPAELESRCQAVCDLTSARRLEVWPLLGEEPVEAGQPGSAEAAADRPRPRRRGGYRGALIYESWSSNAGAGPAGAATGGGATGEAASIAGAGELWKQGRGARLADQANLALANCARWEGVPWAGLARGLGGFRQWSAWWWGGLAGLAATAALVLIPGELKIGGKGTLQPQLRRDVFARADGIVGEITTEHGARCREGDVLLRLTRSQLEVEQSRLLGELQTARQRLSGLQAGRLNASGTTGADRERAFQETAEAEELRQTIEGLKNQQQIMQLQAEELLVRAPMRGEVITWDVRDQLESRPVQRGQVLLTVADLEGPWEVEIEVSDSDMGPVLEARRKSERGNLPVSFLLATEPGQKYWGEVKQVARGAETDRQGQTRVRVVVALPTGVPAQRRPGALVIPQIHCGTAPLGYVWFRAAWDNIRRYVLF